MRACLIATAKNEGPYLLEWVAHHRAVGFTDFLMYQNDSDDLTHKILLEMDRIGAVRYFVNDKPPRNYQIRAYTRAGEELEFKQADWAMALDLDEFLVIRAGEGRLADYLAELPEDMDAVMVNWRLFGCAGHALPSEVPVVERFQRAEDLDALAEDIRAVKTLFRPSVFERPGVHLPKYRGDGTPVIVNGSGLRVGSFRQKAYRTSDPLCARLAQVNHYAIRDAASFLLKVHRGSAHQDARALGRRYWNTKNRNECRDETALRYAGRTAEIRATMDAASGGQLEAMTRRAVARHVEKFHALIEDEKERAGFIYLLSRLDPPK